MSEDTDEAEHDAGESSELTEDGAADSGSGGEALGSSPDDGTGGVSDDGSATAVDATASKAGGDARFCHECGASISPEAEICPECGVRQESGPGAVAGSGDSSESVLAALLSFLIPGAGNFLNGQSERGTIILVLWVAWLVLGWGVGLVLVGGLLTLLTLGLGAILLPILALGLAVIEFAIHVLAAVDAYHQSELVDRVTVRARNVRNN